MEYEEALQRIISDLERWSKSGRRIHKKCITDALTYNNDLANERFLKRNPTSKPYGISYVFEEVWWSWFLVGKINIYIYWISTKNMVNLDEKRQTCRNARTQS